MWCWGNFEEIYHVQWQRRSPGKMVGGANSRLGWNRIPNRDAQRAQTNLVRTRAQEKGEVTPQETDPDLPGSVQESPAEAWVGGGLLQGWGHWV